MRFGTTTPSQVDIPAINGNPNGSFDGPRGSLAVDVEEPALWLKASEDGTLSGWVKMGGPSSSARQIYGGTADPTDAPLVPDDPTGQNLYLWQVGDDSIIVWWNIDDQVWDT